MTKITMSLYSLFIEVECDANHPDATTDLANRASVLFMTALNAAKTNGVDINQPLAIEDDELEDD